MNALANAFAASILCVFAPLSSELAPLGFDRLLPGGLPGVTGASGAPWSKSSAESGVDGTLAWDALSMSCGDSASHHAGALLASLFTAEEGCPSS